MLNKIIAIILILTLPIYFSCGSATTTIYKPQIKKLALSGHKSDLQITLIDSSKYFLEKNKYNFLKDSLIYGQGWKFNEASDSFATQVFIPIDSISYIKTFDSTTGGKKAGKVFWGILFIGAVVGTFLFFQAVVKGIKSGKWLRG